jgi:micrococcal nuclease
VRPGRGAAVFLGALLFALLPPDFALAPLYAVGEVTVYVAPSGKKYHREDCRTLRGSKIAVSLSDAARSGYSPCSVCKPPAAALALAPAPARRPGDLYRVNAAGVAYSAAADISRMVPAEVVDQVDGDTIRLRIGNPPGGLGVVETVRLIGVDTPETKHPARPVERFGKEASAFTRDRLLGKPVYLAFDWDLRDRYDRLLAYVYTREGDCFNATLIREGYGHAYTRFAFHFLEEFRGLEQEARREKRGLWSAD